MEIKSTVCWCLEAPNSNFLKEVIIYDSGQRLIFTNYWYDSVLKFSTKEQAEKFQTDNNLDWLTVLDHLIYN